MADEKTKEVFTVQEAAALLGCHPETIRRAIKRGDLEAAFFGRDYRISKTALSGYFEKKGGGKLF